MPEDNGDQTGLAEVRTGVSVRTLARLAAGLIVVSGLFWLLSFLATGRGIVPFTPDGVVRVFSIDNSGSMSKRKLDNAKRAALNALENLPSGSAVAVQFFGRADCKVEFATKFTREKAAVQAAIETAAAGGETPIADAIRQAGRRIGDVANGRPGEIILLTDGGENCESQDAVLSAARGLNKAARSGDNGDAIGIVLRIIGFDISDSNVEDLLKEAAQLGKGAYYPAANAEALMQAFQQAVEVEDGTKWRVLVVAYGLLSIAAALLWLARRRR